jgi:hypothetical protein
MQLGGGVIEQTLETYPDLSPDVPVDPGYQIQIFDVPRMPVETVFWPGLPVVTTHLWEEDIWR